MKISELSSQCSAMAFGGAEIKHGLTGLAQIITGPDMKNMLMGFSSCVLWARPKIWFGSGPHEIEAEVW